MNIFYKINIIKMSKRGIVFASNIIKMSIRIDCFLKSCFMPRGGIFTKKTDITKALKLAIKNLF